MYRDADADARHVREADVSVHLGPTAAAQSYLSVERVLDAAAHRRAGRPPRLRLPRRECGFRQGMCRRGPVFVGPTPEAIDAMGDKIRAKPTMTAAGIPVVPGRSEPGLSDEEQVAAASSRGFALTTTRVDRATRAAHLGRRP